MFLDLHGYIETEAILVLDAFLMDFKNSDFDNAEIVTGNGIVLKDLAIDAVEAEGFHWETVNGNMGSITIYK